MALSALDDLTVQPDDSKLAEGLGQRAFGAAERAELSQPVRATIAGARRYAEETGFRLPVTTADDLDDVRRLLRIKSDVV